MISHLSSVLYAQFLKNESRRKRLNLFRRINFVKSGNTIHFPNFTTLKAALSSYQTILTCALQNVVLSCAWVGNSSKSTFLLQRDLELWYSHDLPNFPPLSPRNCHNFCTFLFFFAKSSTFTALGKMFGLKCACKLCSTHFCASFLYTKTLALWVWTFLDDEMSVPELCQY